MRDDVSDATEHSDVTDLTVSVKAIEGILIAAMEPVEAALLAQLLELPVSTIEELCDRLALAYADAGHGFQMAKVAGGYRLQSDPSIAGYVERFVLDSQQSRISPAALETLSIIAYKQPISRAQVASIRGVDPDAVIRTLQARGYVAEVGRDEGPGQAIMYGTTNGFLERMGLMSLADLPPISDFVPGADVVEAIDRGLRSGGSAAAPPSA